MRFIEPQYITSFSTLVRIYSDPDEIVFQMYAHLNEQEIAEICREGRQTLHRLRQRFGARSAAELAGIYNIEIARDRWRAAGGKVLYLGECTVHPPKIRLNLETIDSLVNYCARHIGESDKVWFSEARIAEAVTAHELYHILRQHSPSRSLELEAHAFARELTKLPFSALLYSVVLQNLMREQSKE